MSIPRCHYACNIPMVGDSEDAYLHRDGQRWAHRKCWAKAFARLSPPAVQPPPPCEAVAGGGRRVPPKAPAP